jgi:hypothetical protein
LLIGCLTQVCQPSNKQNFNSSPASISICASPFYSPYLEFRSDFLSVAPTIPEELLKALFEKDNLKTASLVPISTSGAAIAESNSARVRVIHAAKLPCLDLKQ